MRVESDEGGQGDEDDEAYRAVMETDVSDLVTE